MHKNTTEPLVHNTIELEVLEDTIEESSQALLKKEKNDSDDKINKTPQLHHSKYERIYWIDALRIFANFLVIFIHCTGVDLKPVAFKSPNWKILYFYNGLAKPCVPLFIMISGLLFLDPKRPVTYRSLYKKSIPRLLRCFLFWSSYYCIVNDMFVNIRGIKYHFSRTLIRDTIKKIIRGGGHLWYLNYAMGLYILTPIFRELIPNKTLTWYTTGLSIFFAQFIPTVFDFMDSFTYAGASVGRDFIDSLRLTTIGNYVNYFMLGYLLNVNTLKKKWQIQLFTAMGIIGVISTDVLRFASSYSLKHESGAFNDYNSFNVTMGTVGIFIYFKYTVNQYLPNLFKWRLFKKVFIALSDCSFGIYLIHMTVYHVIYRFGFHPQSFNPLICAPIYSVLVYLLCFVCIYILRKVPILRLFM